MTYSATILADSPVAYWRLGEASGTTAADEVGSQDGTYRNTAGVLDGVTLGATGAPDGDGDTAASFSNSPSGWVDVPDSATVSVTGAISVECWVKSTDLSGTFVSKVADRVQGTAAQGGFELLNDSDRVRWKISDGTNVAEVAVDDDPYTNGLWHHYVGTWDGTNGNAGNVKLYIDGVLAGTATFSASSILDTSTALRIGAPIGANTVYLNGDIDEVALYNDDLSAARVLAHYCAGQPWAGVCNLSPATCVTDTFTRSNGSVAAAAMDSGHTWTLQTQGPHDGTTTITPGTSALAITSNQAHGNSSPTDRMNIATVDHGASDVDITLDVILPFDTSTGAGIVFRWDGAADFWIYFLYKSEIEANGYVTFLKKYTTAGMGTTVAGPTNNMAASGATGTRTLRVVADGDTIETYFNGSLLYSSLGSQTHNQTATQHGLLGYLGDSSTLFDNYNACPIHVARWYAGRIVI